MPNVLYEDLVDFDHLALYDNLMKRDRASQDDLKALEDEVEAIVPGDTNVIESVKVNNVALVPDVNKAVNVIVPTMVVDLSDADDFATKQYVLQQISGITGVSFEIVQTLPQTGVVGTIYLLANGGSAPNIYDEYIWVNNTFEKIGTTDIDLSGYVQDSDITIVTNAQINSLFTSGS